MATEAPTEAAYALSVGDIYYILFKHKCKILVFSAVGLIAAALAYKLWPNTTYSSEAKLFVRYIKESPTPIAEAEDAEIKSTDQRGETVINGEVEILSSMDLAKQVAIAVGPERILEAYGGGSGVDAAAANTRLGIALARSGDKAGAVQALAQVSGPRASAAKLWTAYAGEPGSLAQASPPKITP